MLSTTWSRLSKRASVWRARRTTSRILSALAAYEAVTRLLHPQRVSDLIVVAARYNRRNRPAHGDHGAA